MTLTDTGANWPGTSGVGFPGPFCDSNGNLYLVGITTGRPEVWKSVNGGTSWTQQDSAGRPGALTAPPQLAAIQVGNTLHMAWHSQATGGKSSSVTVEYHTFTMSDHGSTPDEWVIVNESVVTVAIGDSAETFHSPGVEIAVRSDGDVIVFHPGSAFVDMGTDFANLSYSRREGGSWTTDIALLSEAEEQMHPRAIMAPGDFCHFFFYRDTQGILGRTLTGANANNTGTGVFSVESSVAQRTSARPITWEAAPTKVLVVGSSDADGVVVRRLQEDGASSITGETGQTPFAFQDSAVSQNHNIGLAWDPTNGEAYVFFKDSAQDLLYDHSTGGDDADWTFDALKETTTIFGIWVNFYDRSGDKIGYVTLDASLNLLFGELNLSTGNNFQETLSTSGVVTTTAADQLNAADTLATSVVASTTVADAHHFSETLATSITASTTAQEGLVLTEALATSIVATSTATDDLAMAEALTTSVVATTTTADAHHSSETLSTSIVCVTTAQEGLVLSETLSTSITATVTTTDDLAVSEALATSVVASTTSADDLAMTETLATSIVCTTTMVDTFSGGGNQFMEDLATSITAATTSADTLAMAETLATSITATTTSADDLSLTETLTTSLVGTTTSADVLGASEALSVAIVATTTETDSAILTETLATSITASTTSADGLSFAETLQTNIVATTTSADDLTFTETLVTFAAVTTTSGDQLTAVDAVTTNIVATTTVVDILSGGNVFLETLVTFITATVTTGDLLSAAEDLATTGVVTVTETDRYNLAFGGARTGPLASTVTDTY